LRDVLRCRPRPGQATVPRADVSASGRLLAAAQRIEILAGKNFGSQHPSAKNFDPFDVDSVVKNLEECVKTRNL
jgi:hypothetical protein